MLFRSPAVDRIVPGMANDHTGRIRPEPQVVLLPGFQQDTGLTMSLRGNLIFHPQ